MVKRYGIPVAKLFLQQAAPDVINNLDGSTKPKAAMRNAVEKTIRKQVGGGRGGRVARRVPLRRSNTKRSSSQKRRTTSKKTSRKKQQGKRRIQVKKSH